MADNTTSLPCAVCGTELERVDGQPDIPYGANIFNTTGHYGATAYDSPCGEHLELLICTPCLDGMRERQAIHRVLHATHDTPRQRHVWRSETDTDRDNPLNRQRLRNELAMCQFFDDTDEMTNEWSMRIFDACNEASSKGQPFDPAAVSAT